MERDSDFDRALSYANTALDLLKHGNVPPYPHFYELLYTYATGVNPELNDRINQIFRSRSLSGTEMANRLFDEFVKARSVNERIDTVSRRMSDRIKAMHTAIDSAMATAHEYSGTLTAAREDLDHEDVGESEGLRVLTKRLYGETVRMQDANRDLEDKLRTSREDMASLQRDLDEVRKESMLDPLTKVFNRKCFDQSLPQAISEARAFGDELCLMLIDIDHFKAFNDNYGHQTGDQVLRLVAATIKAGIKGKDIASRYGGEEFTAILPMTGLKQAVAQAQAICEAIASKELLKRSTNEKLGRITASFGVARLHHDDTASSLLERADRCLYEAKARGRNQVVYETELSASAA